MFPGGEAARRITAAMLDMAQTLIAEAPDEAVA